MENGSNGIIAPFFQIWNIIFLLWSTLVLRHEIIINKVKKKLEVNGNIWYKLSENRHKRKNITLHNLTFH